MKTIRAYVVDDEPLAVQRLTRMLEATARVTIAGSTTDPETALSFLNSHVVDVVFLDVQMPGLTGFQLLEKLQSDPLVIFTTAFDHYALNAFAVNSVDYLLKPIERERLDRALDKLQRFAAQPRADVRALARQLAAELAPNRRLERVASRVGERTTILDTARISHFFSKDKLTFAVLNGSEHAIDYTLAQLDDELDPRRFIRIHRGTIVNVTLIQELFPAVDGGMLVRLKDERKTELSVARDRVRDLKARLGI